MKLKLHGKDVALCGLFFALISICAHLRIPISAIPVTLQLASVLLCVLCLKRSVAAVTVTTYIIAGIIGLPVFSSGSGPAYLLAPSFGYTLGFLLAALITPAASSRTDYMGMLLRCLLILLTVHLIGTAYLYLIMNFALQTPISVMAAITAGSLTFLPFDLLWCFVIPIAALRLIKHTKRN